MINIAIFGPPGSGKSTQAKLLIKEWNLCYIATGSLLRKEIEEGSDLGLQIKEKIGNGGFAPDEMMIRIIEKIIRNNSQEAGFLFDGFPRTLAQAVSLEKLFDDLGISFSCLLDLQVSTEECTKRLTARAETSGRTDDNAEVIQFRMKEFAEKTMPVAGFFEKRDLRIVVDAMGPVEEVQGNISSIIAGYMTK